MIAQHGKFHNVNVEQIALDNNFQYLIDPHNV